ncbi:MAG: DEAD/DEAH box helicase [Deltaproteobacteria bacterium]|nr:DEAD/DEAH box helicase [Deltaproteobacteria bacterium]
MNQKPDINEYIRSLAESKRLGSQVAFHTVLDKAPAVFGSAEKPWPVQIEKALGAAGIRELYRHQAKAVDHVRSGRHVVVATPTASGKTLIYNLPFMEKVLENPKARAICLFPLKALAQDQLRLFQSLASDGGIKAAAAIYDGDTSAWHRKKIRQAPPNALLTNPEMLHLSLLPFHHKWEALFANLKMVVVDEVHTYRGVMGSHMAQVFRRLHRICKYYGASPTFVFSSATVANPAELAGRLTGLSVQTVTKSTAPKGRRHIVFVDSLEGPAQTTILLLKAALHRGLRTIVYTQSRKMAELISMWAQSGAGAFSGKISAYRAGFLPEERRAIEAGLARGDLLAVISTSALELGIDIGDLDLCLLVGYPGTIVATWQRGGRVGRSGQDSAMIMIAGEDALDQYFMHNPQDFMQRTPEAAVVNPYNPKILERHLVCAASELPLDIHEPLMQDPAFKKAAVILEKKGALLKSGDGREIYSSRMRPQRHVNLRGSGSQLTIFETSTGDNRGSIDAHRAFRETHPGAVYLHNGVTYIVDDLDLATAGVQVSRAKVNYYTRVKAHKDTEILEIYDKKTVAGTRFYSGRLKVTDQVTGYDMWRIRGHRKINSLPLDLPPHVFETDGVWFTFSRAIRQAVESRQMHFMGGIHAIEHAAIGIFPLLVMADRNDLGGISMVYHPQVDSAAVFIHDSVPGGAGLTRQAFDRAADLLAYTLKIIRSCPCETGCPSCVHSPKCGSGNRPIDKESAAFLLQMLINGKAPVKSAGKIPFLKKPVASPKPGRFPGARFGVLDIETQLSAQEVGGWHRADRMKVSCAVVFDAKADKFAVFTENRMQALIQCLKTFDHVVGFNIKRFDYLVLSGYSDFNFQALPTLDILEDVHKHLGYRLSLDNIARASLGMEKSADGLQALRWWKQGKLGKIIEYCTQDVRVTRDLYLYGLKNRYLLFTNKAGNTVRVPVGW